MFLYFSFLVHSVVCSLHNIRVQVQPLKHVFEIYPPISPPAWLLFSSVIIYSNLFINISNLERYTHNFSVCIDLIRIKLFLLFVLNAFKVSYSIWYHKCDFLVPIQNCYNFQGVLLLAFFFFIGTLEYSIWSEFRKKVIHFRLLTACIAVTCLISLSVDV